MQVKAHLNNLRVAPRKVRQVVDLVRNENVAKARATLDFVVKRAGGPILKLLNSAVTSALNDFKLKEPNLYISKITVDEGPKLKRWHAMSRGRAYPIIKRTSNITLVLSDNLKKEAERTREVKSEKRKTKIKSAKIKTKKT